MSEKLRAKLPHARFFYHACATPNQVQERVRRKSAFYKYSKHTQFFAITSVKKCHNNEKREKIPSDCLRYKQKSTSPENQDSKIFISEM